MGFKEAAMSRQGVVAAIVAVVVVVACGYLLSGGDGASDQRLADRAFYSDDDGKTWFEDSASQMPPFEHAGKQAVRAYVFTNDRGKTKWVGYLERYTAQAKSAIMNSRSGQGEPEEIVRRRLGGGVEVKKPGDAKWVPISDAIAAAAVTSPKAPSGSAEGITLVNP